MLPPPAAESRRAARLPQSKSDLGEDSGDIGEQTVAEEARRQRPARDPGAPTQRMIDEHAATHLPFRSWCPHCVSGRKDGLPHRSLGEADVPGVPEIHMDYGFIRRQDEVSTRTILVLKDRLSRAIQSLVVSNKGVEDASTVDRVVECIRRFGASGRFILKVDNEEALLCLRDRVAEALPQGAVPQGPAPRESASNGVIEVGVKTVKGMTRVHLLALEAKLNGFIPSSHPLMSWLLDFVGDCLSKNLTGSDGKTAYERLTGKSCRDEGLEFAEKLYFRLPPTKDRGVVLDGRWETGVWLGRIWGSPVHRVWAKGRVWEVRSVMRLPKTDRWDQVAVESVAATTWDFKKHSADTVPIEPGIARDGPAADPLLPPRRAAGRPYITFEDLERWGYQDNCTYQVPPYAAGRGRPGD